METPANPQNDQTLQFALAQLRKIAAKACTPPLTPTIRLEFLYNDAGAVFVTRGEVRFDPIVRLPLTADMKLAWIDE